MSVFSKIKPSFGTVAPGVNVIVNQLPAPKVNTLPLIVTDDQIDQIGDDVSRRIGETTQKIVSKMTVGKFDDLGAILTSVSLEAGKLDPASIQHGGLIGWWKRNFTDIKAKLTMQLKTAENVFNDLEGKISKHIVVHQEWVKDLELLYEENYQHYLRIVDEIVQVERLIGSVTNSLESWPSVAHDDPDASMNAQKVRDAEGKLSRLRIKLDSLVRLKTMTEMNSPKIRGQQDTSRATINTLKDVLTQTIPVIKMEFAMFLQTLDSQKSVDLAGNVRELATKTLTTGADSAKMAAVNSAKAMNTPVITTQTLEHIRNRMLEAVTEVKQIETQAQKQREMDYQSITNGQKSLLTSLQKPRNVI